MLPRLKSSRVVGIFEVGMYEFDSGLALIHLEDAQKLYRLDGVSGVRLKLDDLFAAPAVARELARTIDVDAESATGRAATPTSSARCRSRSA